MNRTLITIPLNATLLEIIDTLIGNHISAVIVTAQNGEFMGVISKTDIISALKKYGASILEKTAEDLLNPKPYTIEGSATIVEAAREMITKKVHRLLVVSPSAIGKYMPVGIVTATDILKKLSLV
ncbi:MAG: CBS domain-containing protein [Thermodesulfobacteriaceae bacterium]|nr:CBS domain-containing protein [Thermodesulfobacteriaceae bacterium]